MRAPTELEKLGVMVVSMGITRLLLKAFAPAPVAVPSRPTDPVVARMDERHAIYRHRYGADNPGAN